MSSSCSLVEAGTKIALTRIAEVTKFLSLHGVDHPVLGQGEPSGGDPAYSRVMAVWSYSNRLYLARQHSWDLPGGFTVRSVGFWSEREGGTLYGYWGVEPETYSGQGVYTLTSGTVDLRALSEEGY